MTCVEREEELHRLVIWAVRMQRAFGGGDRLAGELLLNDIAERLRFARDKHSWGGLDAEAASSAMRSSMSHGRGSVTKRWTWR